jgi:hypothetical protein
VLIASFQVDFNFRKQPRNKHKDQQPIFPRFLSNKAGCSGLAIARRTWSARDDAGTRNSNAITAALPHRVPHVIVSPPHDFTLFTVEGCEEGVGFRRRPLVKKKERSKLTLNWLL